MQLAFDHIANDYTRGTIVYAETCATKSSSKGSQSCFTLSESNPTVTLDYGTEIGGFPLFQAKSLLAPVQIEAKYTEAKSGLENASGDGPWTFSNGLTNTFRVETFNVTEPGHIESYFIQGGLRWQQLRLLNAKGSIRICGVGIRSLNDRTSVDALPGYFESSNSSYNEIWALGPRAVQQACIEKGAAPSTWDVTSDGVLLRGQQSAQSVLGATFTNYTMSFMTKILRGGTGWRVANGILGFGPSFVITTDYASESTFINTNKTLLPANKLAVAYGWNLVNQTSLEGGPVSYYSLPFDVKEGEWVQVTTTIKSTGYDVSINNSSAIHVPLSALQPTYNYLGSAADEYSGTWGFGPYQDQVAYVRDVEVHAQNGTLLYDNPMTSTSVLEEYGVMPNRNSVCLDGAKRDRLVWSGDFSHTSRIIAASTHREDFIKGTLAYLLDRQMASGEFAGYFSMSPSMGQSSKYTSTYHSVGLEDYQLLFLNAFARYYLYFADKKFLEKYWFQVKTGVESILSLVDSSSGLASGSFFLGAANGTAASSLLVYTLKHMATLADNVGEAATSAHWRFVAAGVSKAINKRLWSNNLGTYGISTTSLNETSIAGTAWAILADVADSTQAESAIAALSSLRNGIGYKTLSTTESSAELSPFISGFLLEALLKHSRNITAPSAATTAAISTLLSGLWPAMIDNDEYYTGTSWEYVFPDGRPGLDLYTSHAHPWGAAPTFVLTEYVLGVQPTAPGFSEWVFKPAVLTPGVSWARGRVPTPHGSIEASWKLREEVKEVDLRICSPRETKGTVFLAIPVKSAKINGLKKGISSAGGFSLDVTGGQCSEIVLALPHS
ncbi:hypothetical protein PENANT_c004G01211 [Penicillium antarcticum]|uniref:Alpha-L-rhamnosidase C-terminal domain-containing protein n=1 Tax=Penicillium antarcticum TaxID=416450 RepID=A0A1V6QGB7_9EURO|nr:uncharacterized protein N7508_002353 [Penicillium antarcticum]KAJ5317845.1 hypothetical protein N7508_002353 [Penicillium antarcticum]OQD88254.1 hypothetical protein PENANT_c004G01211 [Penicillium antarcticum]